jgi:RNA polymerase sigma-70 factor (ECF subfamily)
MSGNGDSWSTWLDRHGAALVLFARQWAPNRADAEDIVQEAFIRFWRSRERVTEPISYLYASVKHCALDWHRGRNRQMKRETLVARPEAEALFAGPAEQEERRAAIEAKLSELPEAQREVLVLMIWGGLSFQQIAKTLQISANTAASRYRYALAKLREQLQEESVR